MFRRKLSKIILFTMLAHSVFFLGCANIKTIGNSINIQYGATSTLDSSSINSYGIATKNTTRIMGINAAEIALSTSKMIWPAPNVGNRPNVAVIAPSESWQIQLLAANLLNYPNNGPMLLTSNNDISEYVLSELYRLSPSGIKDGIHIITVFMSDRANKQLTDLGYKVKSIQGENIFKVADEIDAYYTLLAGELSDSVVVSSSEYLQYSLPAANWVSHMPEPLLYVEKDLIPAETIHTLQRRNGQANIYLLGPETIISKNVETELGKYGKVTRISGNTPHSNAVAFAKFKDVDTGFGWGISTPGHGFLLVDNEHVQKSIAAAAFSHRGKHAPLLLTDSQTPPKVLVDFLKELKPFYRVSPAEGPYNHLYIAGGKEWVTLEQQAYLDYIIEVDASNNSAYENNFGK